MNEEARLSAAFKPQSQYAISWVLRTWCGRLRCVKQMTWQMKTNKSRAPRLMNKKCSVLHSIQQHSSATSVQPKFITKWIKSCCEGVAADTADHSCRMMGMNFVSYHSMSTLVSNVIFILYIIIIRQSSLIGMKHSRRTNIRFLLLNPYRHGNRREFCS